MKLRKHQRQAIERARRILSGAEESSKTVAHVTPGGGKTLMSALFANEMIKAGYVDRVVVICPRDSLRTQMVESFMCADLGLSNRVIVWDPKKSRIGLLFNDSCGVVTTFQAAVRYTAKLEKLVAGARTLLIVDEGHHMAGADDDDDVEDDYAAWKAAVEPLIRSAVHTLLMTGTLYRSDEDRIPFVDYEDNKPIAHIRYTRQDALIECAVLPIEFRMWDGDAEFTHRGSTKKTKLSTTSERDWSRTVRTLLADHRGTIPGEAPGYVLGFLRNALGEWAEYRRSVYRSKAIIVCLNQPMAEWVNDRVRSMGFDSTLAISREKHSSRRIKFFRKGTGGDVLVTVGMAYEGLDVPDATHLLLLTNRRARPWLEQAVARVTRVNRGCDLDFMTQRAYVYVMDDGPSRQFVDQMLSEQDDCVPERERKEKKEGAPRGPSTFRPISGVATVRREGSDVDGRIPEHMNQIVQKLRKASPEWAGLSAREVLARFEAVNGCAC